MTAPLWEIAAYAGDRKTLEALAYLSRRGRWYRSKVYFR